MKQEITEAAIKWWVNINFINEQQKLVNKHFKHSLHFAENLDYQLIVSIWIQEVVMKWAKEITPDHRNELYESCYGKLGYAEIVEMTDEQLATIYLKEQENKEPVSDVVKCPYCDAIKENGNYFGLCAKCFRFPNANKESSNVSEIGICEFCGIEQSLSNLSCHYKVCGAKVVRKEEPVSLSVEGLENPLTKYIKDKHTQEECIGFSDGFREAKEQDKELIKELLEAYKENIPPNIESARKKDELIKRTMDYLNKTT